MKSLKLFDVWIYIGCTVLLTFSLVQSVPVISQSQSSTELATNKIQDDEDVNKNIIEEDDRAMQLIPSQSDANDPIAEPINGTIQEDNNGQKDNLTQYTFDHWFNWYKQRQNPERINTNTVIVKPDDNKQKVYPVNYRRIEIRGGDSQGYSIHSGRPQSDFKNGESINRDIGGSVTYAIPIKSRGGLNKRLNPQPPKTEVPKRGCGTQDSSSCVDSSHDRIEIGRSCQSSSTSIQVLSQDDSSESHKSNQAQNFNCRNDGSQSSNGSANGSEDRKPPISDLSDHVSYEQKGSYSTHDAQTQTSTEKSSGSQSTGTSNKVADTEISSDGRESKQDSSPYGEHHDSQSSGTSVQVADTEMSSGDRESEQDSSLYGEHHDSQGIGTSDQGANEEKSSDDRKDELHQESFGERHDSQSSGTSDQVANGEKISDDLHQDSYGERHHSQSTGTSDQVADTEMSSGDRESEQDSSLYGEHHDSQGIGTSDQVANEEKSSDDLHQGSYGERHDSQSSGTSDQVADTEMSSGDRESEQDSSLYGEHHDSQSTGTSEQVADTEISSDDRKSERHQDSYGERHDLQSSGGFSTQTSDEHGHSSSHRSEQELSVNSQGQSLSSQESLNSRSEGSLGVHSEREDSSGGEIHSSSGSSNSKDESTSELEFQQVIERFKQEHPGYVLDVSVYEKSSNGTEGRKNVLKKTVDITGENATEEMNKVFSDLANDKNLTLSGDNENNETVRIHQHFSNVSKVAKKSDKNTQESHKLWKSSHSQSTSSSQTASHQEGLSREHESHSASRTQIASGAVAEKSSSRE